MKKLLDLPLYKMINSSLIILPTPVNISIWWNLGSMLGVSLMIQILSGFFLSMHYCPHIDLAFYSLVHIMQDVNWGWLIRLIHMNGASLYFIFMYIHIARGIYYHSFFKISVWVIGVFIMLASMAAAFMGYVLPWGQMSFWGATVITNLMSAIPYLGGDIVQWLWGGFSINNATLNRFYSFHFLLPFIILVLVILHLYFLHMYGSNNPSGLSSLNYMISFHPYFTFKDILGFLFMFFLLILICLQFPNSLGDPDNYMPANSLVTPLHIQPEWYFLFSYSILRSIPSKLGGVLALFLSILILLILPFSTKAYMLGLTFYPITQVTFWLFIVSVILLTWTGARPIEYPYFQLGQIMSFMYFTYFIMSLYIYLIWDFMIFKD